MTFSLKLLTVRYMALRQGRNLGLSRRQGVEKALYYYPQYDDSQITAKVPSQELSNAMIKALKGNTEG